MKEKMFAQWIMVDIHSSDDDDMSLCTSPVFFFILGSVSDIKPMSGILLLLAPNTPQLYRKKYFEKEPNMLQRQSLQI